MRAEKAEEDSSGLAAMLVRLSMAQFGLWRFLSQGWMDRGGLWKTACTSGSVVGDYNCASR